jgi:flagellar protein FliO/FliZ
MMDGRTRTFFLLGLALLALAALAPHGAWAVTEQDLATMNVAAETTKKVATPEAGLSLSWLLARMAASLGVVFGLMWAVLWAAKKYLPQTAKGTRGGLIEVLATRPIGQRRSLMLVRTQGKTLLLGVTPSSIQTLAELEPEAEPGNWADAALEAGLPPQ